MKKLIALLGVIAVLLSISACEKKLQRREDGSISTTREQLSAQTPETPESVSAAEKQNTGEALPQEEQKTELFQYQTLPSELSDAMTTERCTLLPWPDENAKELGFLWRYHRVTVIERVQVTCSNDDRTEAWYLVKLAPHQDDTCNIGWLPESAVTEYDPAAQLPEDAMYRLLPNASYSYPDGSTYINADDREEMNPFFLSGGEEGAGFFLTAYGGEEIVVDTMDYLCPADDYLQPPAWENVP